MNRDIRVAIPPARPLLVFDGDCNFCALWIRRWRQMTGDAVDYLPAQDASMAARFPEIPREQFESAVQFIETDGAVYSGAEAVFRALAKHPKRRRPLSLYESQPVFASSTEWAYRLVAGNRTFFSWLTRWCWGRHVEAPEYILTRWFFLRALGLVYLVAFLSLWPQVNGLIGHDGILPANQFMSALQQQCEVQGIGISRYHLLPTLCWFNASDGFLQFQCAAGTLLAVLLIIGIAPAPCLALLWMFYLSLTNVGQDFLSFQWDNLLLEAGFLAIFLAPLQLLPRSARAGPPSRAMIWLFRLLLFKLMFSSGCVKLLSGDPSWRNLTALSYHYHTQPLPTWMGWYADQLPLWFQKLSCLGTFGSELGAPCLIFAPRRIRFLGGAAIAFLQILILLTGNYTFFNFLTLAICLLLLDDFVFKKLVPAKWRNFRPTEATLNAGGASVPASRSHPTLTSPSKSRIHARRWSKFIIIPITSVIAAISVFQVASLFGARAGLWKLVAMTEAELAPFRTVNSYGLFAVMTTNRREIVVQGSNDGTHWRSYEFKYKPGDLHRRPVFIEPFQPRLDWQMWFAALGDYRQNLWFVNFCERLLQGAPEVLALLDKNPFPGRPPRFIRAELYEYRFTTFAERRKTGDWWKRNYAGHYLPVVSLKDHAAAHAGELKN
jgi:predicted DCC family thiol-disulfide oxidoreductase YuxK